MKIPAFPRAVLWLFMALGISVYSQAPYSTAEFKLSITQQTANSANHQTLLAAIKAAELEETLNSDGPFTIFAPSDAAFDRWSSQKTADLLLPKNQKKLKSFVTYHIIAGELTAAKILKALCRGEGKANFTTVQGNKLHASMDGIDIVLTDEFGNSARITRADSNQCNGVLHEIDSVILPRRM